MAHGQPDYGMYGPKTTTYVLEDMGELAVRLGSINIFDRRGDVIALDDFEDTILKWDITVRPGATILLDSTHVRSGSQAFKITTRAAHPDAPSMWKGFAVSGKRRLGAEISFSNPPATTRLELTIGYADDTDLVWGRLVLDFGAGTLSIADTAGTTLVIAAGLVFGAENHLYFPVKLVVDFDTGYYVRLILLNVEYDLTAYPLVTQGAPYVEIESVEIQLHNDITAVSDSLWIDDFIFTQDEP